LAKEPLFTSPWGTAGMSKNRFKILVVDDSADDRLFMRLTIERSDRLIVVGEARDGHEAIEYLTGQGVFHDRERYPYPDILLLDLKMPRRNGFDVLQWLHAESIKNLTVFVLSGSWLAEDIARSQEMGAHGYFKKTSEKLEQEAMLEKIVELAEDRP